MKKALTLLITLMLSCHMAKAENLDKCLKGWNSTESGNYIEAISLYEMCMHEGQLSNSSLTRTYRNLGITYRRSKDFQNAVLSYNKAIALNPPDVVDDYVNRGNAYDQDGKFIEALADYETALSLKPHYNDVYYNRGIAYENNKMYEKATEQFILAYKYGLRSNLLYERLVAYKIIKE